MAPGSVPGLGEETREFREGRKGTGFDTAFAPDTYAPGARGLVLDLSGCEPGHQRGGVGVVPEGRQESGTGVLRPGSRSLIGLHGPE